MAYYIANSCSLRCSSVLFRPQSFCRTSRQLQAAYNKRLVDPRSREDTRRSYIARERNEDDRALGKRCISSGALRTDLATSNIIRQATRLSSTSSTTPVEPQISGPLSLLPRSVVPYAQLIRLDKPIGTYYLFLPCLFSTLLAAPLATPMASPLTVLGTSALFFSGAVIMRGAGCTVNDLWDRDFDKHVARTKLRPIARGAITVNQAIPFLGVQLLTGLGVLLQFPYQCLFYAIPSLLFVGIYPLAKRVTNYPQFVLGLTFSWGAMMGFPALGIDLLSNGPALASAACLYGSCVAWTMVYDMIYAYQDIKDDAKAGIKSIALAQEKNAKAFLTAVSAVQVALLAGAGVSVGAGPAFFVGTCGGAAVTLGHMIRKVNLGSVADCWTWFNKGAWFTGGAISVGLLGEYLAQVLGLYAEERDEPAKIDDGR